MATATTVVKIFQYPSMFRCRPHALLCFWVVGGHSLVIDIPPILLHVVKEKAADEICY
jgi:hypothetical protein